MLCIHTKMLLTKFSCILTVTSVLSLWCYHHIISSVVPWIICRHVCERIGSLITWSKYSCVLLLMFITNIYLYPSPHRWDIHMIYRTRLLDVNSKLFGFLVVKLTDFKSMISRLFNGTNSSVLLDRDHRRPVSSSLLRQFFLILKIE